MQRRMFIVHGVAFRSRWRAWLARWLAGTKETELLKHITGATTLGEIAALRSQYGITRMKVEIDFEALDGPVLVVLTTPDLAARGRGKTDAEALDDAFGRLAHRIGAGLPKGRDS